MSVGGGDVEIELPKWSYVHFGDWFTGTSYIQNSEGHVFVVDLSKPPVLRPINPDEDAAEDTAKP